MSLRPAVPLLALAAFALALSCGEQPAPTLPPDAGHSEVDAGLDGSGDAGDAGDAGEQDAGFDAGDLDGGLEDAGDGGDGGEEDAGFDAGCWGDPGDPPNRAPNPSFECGDPPEGWVPGPNTDLATETAAPFSGAQAVRIASPSGGAAASLYPASTPVQAPGAAAWCATAMVRGEEDGGTVRIALIRYASTGGFTEFAFSEVLHTGWQRIDMATRTTTNDQALGMRVYLHQPAAGDALLVDDVQLWSSPDGGCFER